MRQELEIGVLTWALVFCVVFLLWHLAGVWP